VARRKEGERHTPRNPGATLCEAAFACQRNFRERVSLQVNSKL
jgi:hypothetical protein